MNKMQLFVAIIICSIKIQASEAGVVDANEVEIAAPVEIETTVTRSEQDINYQPVPMNNDCQSVSSIYGTTSSVADSDSGARNEGLANLASYSFGFEIFKTIRVCCFPCCIVDLEHPDDKSCCCQNSCGRCLFTCCMT